METVRISALSPPSESKSKWAREMLTVALGHNLSPKLLPGHLLKSFTVSLPTTLAKQLRERADGEPTPVFAAGMIEAAKDFAGTSDSECSPVSTLLPSITGIERVRPLLHDLLEQSVEHSENGKIVFAEAATGAGKGRMIASAAAHAVSQSKSVVISAPLAVSWQLMEDLSEVKTERPLVVALALGRPNFVSPPALKAWAEDAGHQAILDWIEQGGKALSDHAIKTSAFTNKELRWLLEDALLLADDIPVSVVMLAAPDDDDEQCEGEKTYQALKNKQRKDEVDIFLCSHFMLAAHTRQMQISKNAKTDPDDAYSLPTYIDTLIVDEAHQLESAFAAIYSHNIHIRALARMVDSDVKRGRKPLLASIASLGSYIQQNPRKTESLSDMNGLSEVLKDLKVAVDGAYSKALPSHTKAALNTVRSGIEAALSGYMLVSTAVSPVRLYPQISIGRANLQSAMEALWDRAAGAILVSATLYGDSNSGAKLMRWKLGVPVDRAHYLPVVHPSWVFKPVTLHDDRVSIEPNDSDKWADESAAMIERIAEQALGGTLVLCTSFSNAEKLADRLESELGKRLITQTASMNASACASLYRTLYKAGKKPVWIGLGSAWTGINLSDDESEPEQDRMLTDLVVTRLPMGVNRTIMSERRIRSVGFSVVIQEASWILRQGMGRLVRREGVAAKNLWVLDNRIDSPANWAVRLRKMLTDRYGKMQRNDN